MLAVYHGMLDNMLLHIKKAHNNKTNRKKKKALLEKDKKKGKGSPRQVIEEGVAQVGALRGQRPNGAR